MNKLKNVFQRSQKLVEERKSHQFMKRHSSTTSSQKIQSEQPNAPPSVNFFELSEMEKPFFQSCWKDLDPFGLDKISNHTVLKFLSGCTLEDSKLEKILALFETAGDGLNQSQLFAMLRLIAHAQSGRKINRALAYLGAPLPRFHANTIDALIKSDITKINGKKSQEKSQWWQNEPQKTSTSNRHSYGGLFTVYNSASKVEAQPDIILNFDVSNTNYTWKHTPNEPLSFNQLYSSAHKPEYSHSRSRSADNAAKYIQPDDTQGPLHSSKSSLSLHELNNASNSLLLTQKFVYQSPSLKKQELPQSKNNPFYPFIPDICSPFDDINYSDQIEAVVQSTYIPTYSNKSTIHQL